MKKKPKQHRPDQLIGRCFQRFNDSCYLCRVDRLYGDEYVIATTIRVEVNTWTLCLDQFIKIESFEEYGDWVEVPKLQFRQMAENCLDDIEQCYIRG